MIQVRRPQFVNKSKVLTLADWEVAFDARYHGGCMVDTLGSNPCRIDGDTCGYIRDWAGIRHATQGTAANQRAWQDALSGEIDGLSAVGADDTYTISNSTGFGVATHQHGFIVLNTLGVAPGSNRFIFAAASNTGLQIRHLATTGNLTLAITGVGAVGSAVATANGVSLVEYMYTSGSHSIKFNDGAAGTGATATTLASPITEMMGSFGGSFEGDFYCWYAYQGTSALPANVVTAVRAQLAREFATTSWT